MPEIEIELILLCLLMVPGNWTLELEPPWPFTIIRKKVLFNLLEFFSIFKAFFWMIYSSFKISNTKQPVFHVVLCIYSIILVLKSIKTNLFLTFLSLLAPIPTSSLPLLFLEVTSVTCLSFFALSTTPISEELLFRCTLHSLPPPPSVVSAVAY